MTLAAPNRPCMSTASPIDGKRAAITSPDDAFSGSRGIGAGLRTDGKTRHRLMTQPI